MRGLSFPEQLLRLAVAAVFMAGVLIAVTAGEAATLVLYLPYAAVGAFLTVRRPGNVVGFLLTLVGWSQCLGTLRVTSSRDELVAATASLPERIAASSTGTLWAFAFVAFVALAFLFPEGRLPVGRVRPVARMTLAGTIVLALLITFNPTVSVLLPSGEAEIPNVFAPFPEEVRASLPSSAILFPLFGIPALVAIAWTTARYRRAADLERLQLRWLAAALALVAVVTAVWAISVVGLGGAATTIGWVAVAAGYPAVPVAIAVAVMRYRLFEIDRIISRTISWTLVSGGLAALFAALVVGLQPILAPITAGSSIAVAGSTLVVLAAFQPVRRRVQRLVDRRFNRTGAEAERAADRFIVQLRDETDLGRITARLLAAAELAVSPACGGLWVRQPGEDAAVAGRPACRA